MLPWSLDDLPLFPNVDLHSLRPDSRPASYLDTTRPLFPVVDSGFGSPPVAIDTPSPHTSPPKPRNTIRRDPEYVPRPRNSFMLFRLDLNARRGSLAQKDLSRVAGAFWRRLPETKKKIYKEMANREKEIHKAKYPQYSYKYNDALSRLREPSNALNQPNNNSTELTAGAAGLTDGTLPPLSRICYLISTARSTPATLALRVLPILSPAPHSLDLSLNSKRTSIPNYFALFGRPFVVRQL